MRFRRRIKLTNAERVRHFVWPKSGWHRALRYVWHRVWRLADSPHVVAIGFASGAFASFTPLVGFHFIIGFAVAWILRGNLIASAFCTAVGNPLSFPFIWFSIYEVGAWVLGSNGAGDKVDLSGGLFANSMDTLLPLLKPMMVGGLLLGPIAGLVSYLLVKPAVAVYQSRRRIKFAEHATRRAARDSKAKARADKKPDSAVLPGNPPGG